MAIRKTRLVQKGVNHRGLYSGKHQSVTAIYSMADGAEFPTADVLHAIPVGEGVRIDRIILRATPTDGSPALTGATFNVGVAPVKETDFVRPDGTEFPPPAEAATALASAVAVDTTDLMATVIEVKRPVANTVSKYGPYFVTLTPTAAMSVAGGDIDLSITVEFVGEENTSTVYGEYNNTKVKNDA